MWTQAHCTLCPHLMLIVFVGLDRVPSDVTVFHAGTSLSDDGQQVLTSGGRVLALVSVEYTLQKAVARVLNAANSAIAFECSFHRKDIAHRALAALKDNVQMFNGRLEPSYLFTLQTAFQLWPDMSVECQYLLLCLLIHYYSNHIQCGVDATTIL